MAKTGNEQDKTAADHPTQDSARSSTSQPNMADMPYFSEALSMNPLLANPAAAMAAATAIGFGFANQMASAFFGVMQSAMEAANRHNASPEAPRTNEAAAPVATETVVTAGAAVTEPAAPAKPAAAKRKAVAKATKPAVEKKVSTTPAPAVSKTETKAAPKAADKAPVKAPAKAKAAARPASIAGDLKRISGIGPKLEGILKGKGVVSLADVAAWTNEDIARFDKELGFEGRIVRDDWVGQAKALLK